MTETISVELDREIAEKAATAMDQFHPGTMTECASCILVAKLRAALDSPQPSNEARYEEALQQAEIWLGKACDGLDIGLACARDLEDDDAAFPTQPRSADLDHRLRNMRLARSEVRALLHPDTQEVEGA